MAIVRVGAGFGFDLLDADFDFVREGVVRSTSARRVVVRDEDGSTVTVTGSGFAFDDDGAPTAGTVTGIAVTAGGDPVVTSTGLTIGAVALFEAGVTPSDRDDEALFARALSGNDRLTGAGLRDRLAGFAGDDVVSGGGGADVLDGGRGNDVVRGDAGDDRVSGGDGADNLFGGAGADRLTGGAGNDTMAGGAGRDFFLFTANVFGNDTITGYSAAQDRLDLRPTTFDLGDLLPSLTPEGLLLRFRGGSDTILLAGLQAAQLDAVVDSILF